MAKILKRVSKHIPDSVEKRVLNNLSKEMVSCHLSGGKIVTMKSIRELDDYNKR